MREDILDAFLDAGADADTEAKAGATETDEGVTLAEVHGTDADVLTATEVGVGVTHGDSGAADTEADVHCTS